MENCLYILSYEITSAMLLKIIVFLKYLIMTALDSQVCVTVAYKKYINKRFSVQLKVDNLIQKIHIVFHEDYLLIRKRKPEKMLL